MRASQIIIALAALVAGAAANLDTQFAAFVKQHDKHYTPTEYRERRALFAATVARVEAHNAKASTFKLGINKFADATEVELAALRGFNAEEWRRHTAGKPRAAVRTGSTPSSLSWVDEGIVTPVKNQGSCGSCWTFSGVGTIESNLLFNNQTETILSEQMYVDCAPNPENCGGTGGCQGSTQPLLFDYAVGAGSELESEYVYTAHDGVCKADDYSVVATIQGYGILPENCDNDVLETYLYEQGPIAVSVDASTWSAYSGGIMDFDSCGSTINHAVLLTGYGSEDGVDYWTIKNSWGSSWGEDGFIRISRDATFANDTAPADGTGCDDGPAWVEVRGTCGILYANSYVFGAATV